MESSDTPAIPPPTPVFSHRLPFHHHHHLHLHLQPSPHCPQHGGYLLRPNTHLQLSSNCPLHGHLLPPCQLHTPNFHPNNQRFPITPNFYSTPNPNFNSVPPEAEIDANINIEEEEEEEEGEDEFMFVLTDEWKEFFAKSEAKRRLAKKQAKKKGKGKD
ncbi:uncharacterized protein LOC143569391 [Bidens hawaiensis]|uniref:uncharacterized protein LOC143569391 n=1 Tax=Bidens hawaiensis TaxID=980011 RepID=UPI0040491555